MIYFTGDTHGEISRFKTSAAKKLIFKTRGRLINRPIEEIVECLKPFGVTVTKRREDN